MSDKIDLKPCPFCGSTTVHPDTNGNMTWIICLGCGATGKRCWNGKGAIKQAAEAWNRRERDE